MNISENLRRIREERNVKQIELANAVGISQAMLSQLERGTKNLTVNLAVEIIKALKCDISDLISIWNIKGGFKKLEGEQLY